MTIEQGVLKRLRELVAEGEELRYGSVHNQCKSEEHIQNCRAWITTALHLVQIICPTESNAYRKRAEEIAARSSGWIVHQDVGEFAVMLKHLARDVEAGLLTSIADRARAETFDDFLDHGRAYQREQRKSEAGVIVGVVFEDTVRRICRKNGIDDNDTQLDSLIGALTKNGMLSGAKAKRARVAAHVRTKATHALWNEFDLADVGAAIEITQELINAHLDRHG